MLTVKWGSSPQKLGDVFFFISYMFAAAGSSVLEVPLIIFSTDEPGQAFAEKLLIK
jgi:hypothetical protein